MTAIPFPKPDNVAIANAEMLATAEALINGGRDDAAMAIIAAERAEVLALRKERDIAYARGVHDAARAIDTAGDGVVTEALSTQLCCNGHHCGCQGADVGAYLQHIIRALADAPPAPGVKVKLLVWENVPTGYGPETYQAYAATGFYQVFTDEDSSCGAVFAEFSTNESQFGTVHARSVARVGGFIEAKSAAQADYEARIRAALEGGEG